MLTRISGLIMGMVIFQEAGVDYVILETGLGGRMDATTSVENPLACGFGCFFFAYLLVVTIFVTGAALHMSRLCMICGTRCAVIAVLVIRAGA